MPKEKLNSATNPKMEFFEYIKDIEYMITVSKSLNTQVKSTSF